MTDRYAQLRAALDARAKGGSAGYERYLDKATPETIRALLADYDRMRDALRLAANWISAAEHRDDDCWGGGHCYCGKYEIEKTITAALAQEHGGSDGSQA